VFGGTVDAQIMTGEVWAKLFQYNNWHRVTRCLRKPIFVALEREGRRFVSLHCM
jgi:hypothetical protein